MESFSSQEISGELRSRNLLQREELNAIRKIRWISCEADNCQVFDGFANGNSQLVREKNSRVEFLLSLPSRSNREEILILREQNAFNRLQRASSSSSGSSVASSS
jgi:hypothetical protein